MHAYTLAFIKRKNEILLLNRNKSPWMGAWNGVGGKIHPGETPLEGIIREIYEETNLVVSKDAVKSKGVLTWERFEAIGGGLYLFLVEVDESLEYLTPIKTDEGILDWKRISWATDFANEGIAKNIPHFLPTLLDDSRNFTYHCTFDNGILTSVEKKPIEGAE